MSWRTSTCSPERVATRAADDDMGAVGVVLLMLVRRTPGTSRTSSDQLLVNAVQTLRRLGNTPLVAAFRFDPENHYALA